MIPTTINWQPALLEDDLIQLLPLQTADFEALYEAASDPLIWEQHPEKERYKKDVFQLYFDNAIASKSAFIMLDKKSGKVIGSTRYHDYKPESSSIGIGYTFLIRECWGGLYNQSSKKLLLNHAFQYVDKVFFQIGTNNIRSQKATMKLGAKKVGAVELDLNGKKLPHFTYVITKEEMKI